MRRRPESRAVNWTRRKVETLRMQAAYLLGDDSPAYQFLRRFRGTSTIQAVPGSLGVLRGHGSQTVVVDFNLEHFSSTWQTDKVVLKFERIPGIIPRGRLATERTNELRARRYLDDFLPPTLRILGHGIENRSSAMTYQEKVYGKRLRDVSSSQWRAHPIAARELVRFCDAVDEMARETGQTPDLCGTLAHFDQPSNLFWQSRNIVVDLSAGRVWLVDTGWKEGEESLRHGRLASRFRTWFRLQTMRLFRWRLARMVGAEHA